MHLIPLVPLVWGDLNRLPISEPPNVEPHSGVASEMIRVSIMRNCVAAIASAMVLAGACGEDNGMQSPSTPPATEPPMQDTTLRSYDSDDQNIQYTGRIDSSNPKLYRFSGNGTYITARFKGTGVSASLKDEFRYGKYRNFYDAILDGVIVKKVAPDPTLDSPVYAIASDLPYGEHQITLVRRTEPTVGLGFFLGFQFAGEILPPPARPAHRIEIVGDSITAGAGIDARAGDPACNAPPDGWGLPVEDVYKSYGPALAQDLGAEYHVLGISGFGLVRDYSTNPADDLRTMPQVYDLLFPQLTSSTSWDSTHTKWVPDAMVIGLGTNDFSPGDNPSNNPRPIMDQATFVSAYIAFINTLRGYYPDAQFFLISSPLLSDGWPTAAYRSASDLRESLATVEDHFIAAGDPKVHKFYVSYVVSNGCGHPDATQQLLTAQELKPFIKTTMGW